MAGWLASVPGKLNTFLSRLTAARAANLDNCDSPVSDCAKTSDSRFNNLTRLDATVSSRLAAEDYKSSPIKSIQGNLFSFVPGSSGSINISAVDVNKSIVILSCKNGFYYYNDGSNVKESFALTVGGGLHDSTTLTWMAGGDSPTATRQRSGVCYWQVIEFN